MKTHLGSSPSVVKQPSDEVLSPNQTWSSFWVIPVVSGFYQVVSNFLRCPHSTARDFELCSNIQLLLWFGSGQLIFSSSGLIDLFFF